VGNQLEQEWQTVSGAPFLTIAVVIVIGFALWAILHFLYRHRIEGMKEEIERLRARGQAPPAKADPSPPLSAPLARPAAKREKAKVENKAAELPPQPDDRIFVGDNVTAGFLMALYEGVTKMQGDRRAGAYIGKWMRISGEVKNVYPSHESGSVAVKVPDVPPITAVMLIFHGADEQLEILHQKDAIDAVGKIYDISNMHIQLEDCEFVRPR
jgi:hypothetical protein